MKEKNHNNFAQKKDFTDRSSDISPVEDENLVEGRNAVIEAIRAGLPVDRLFIADPSDAALRRISSLARENGAVISETNRAALDRMSGTGAHQGVIAVIAARAYSTVDDILLAASSRGEAPLLIVCDELTDPRNLGAVIRSGEAAGAHGIIIPKRRSVGLTAVVDKTSAGAAALLPVARVPNIPSLLNNLKDSGLWIFGAAADGETDLYRADFKCPTAIVIGSEGSGMSRLVAERCDFRVSIPMRGKIGSLNASVAAGILLYEAVRQRYYLL